MWNCHKCGKPVFFAERKQSMGFDFHPDCLKCQECGKILKQGQHAEHKGVPYCHVPCYGALFGPQLFGHGTRVESHKSFGKIENKTYCGITRNHLETMIKTYNNYYEVHGGSGGIKSREVNGRLILEGVLRLYWGVHSAIQLKEDDDQRLPCNTSSTKFCRRAVSNGIEFENSSFDSDNSDNLQTEVTQIENDDPRPAPINGSSTAAEKSSIFSQTPEASSEILVEKVSSEPSKYKTVPSKLDTKQLSQWDELDEILQVEREWKDHEKPYHTMPSAISSNQTSQVNDSDDDLIKTTEAALDTANKSNRSVPAHSGRGSGLQRRPGRRFDKTKLRRRCSINGHYYNRETSVFTPPYGSSMSVWTTSLVSTQEVINMLLDKYRVECPALSFTILVVKDNGERRRVRDDEFPLLLRVMQGPDESVAKLFLVESGGEESHEVSAAVAQFLHLSQAECSAILRLYSEEEEREVQNIRDRNRDLKRRIKKRMMELKVKL